MNKILTKKDYNGAIMVIKTSVNPKEIKTAQQIIKEYKKQSNKEDK